MITVHQHRSGRIGAPAQREVMVRWRQIDPRPDGPTMAVVVLQDADSVERPAVVIAAQQTRINRLLVRQTLIEEAERRRLGRALHDVVAQDLAQLRRSISDQKVQIGDVEPLLARLDRVIDEVRTLSFELSPPILEDLGLCPALQWLAEHVSKRYGTRVAVTPDATEPHLASSTRTIVFRAVRELLINAAKHAPNAEVTVSCGAVGNVARVVVRDTGPGFDTSLTHTFSDGVHHFGLMSVEQQIRGIGGTFDLVSSLGTGTTIWISVPLEPQEEEADV
jgi:signal transduction histidine kinase